MTHRRGSGGSTRTRGPTAATVTPSVVGIFASRSLAANHTSDIARARTGGCAARNRLILYCAPRHKREQVITAPPSPDATRPLPLGRQRAHKFRAPPPAQFRLAVAGLAAEHDGHPRCSRGVAHPRRRPAAQQGGVQAGTCVPEMLLDR